jgi:hypothetical protein
MHSAALQSQAQQLDGFAKSITNSTYMDLLNQYNVHRGSFRGDFYTSDYLSGNSVDDSTIRKMLDYDIADNESGYSLPFPNANRLYMIYLAPNIESSYVAKGKTYTSGTDYYGYHSSFYDFGTNVIYAVIANPVGNSDIPHLSAFQQQTEVSSHELAEAATDPLQNAWYDNKLGSSYGEIGDLASLQYGTYQGYIVQKEWSNSANAAVMPIPKYEEGVRLRL